MQTYSAVAVLQNGQKPQASQKQYNKKPVFIIIAVVVVLIIAIIVAITLDNSARKAHNVQFDIKKQKEKQAASKAEESRDVIRSEMQPLLKKRGEYRSQISVLEISAMTDINEAAKKQRLALSQKYAYPSMSFVPPNMLNVSVPDVTTCKDADEIELFKSTEARIMMLEIQLSRPVYDTTIYLSDISLEAAAELVSTHNKMTKELLDLQAKQIDLFAKIYRHNAITDQVKFGHDTEYLAYRHETSKNFSKLQFSTWISQMNKIYKREYDSAQEKAKQLAAQISILRDSINDIDTSLNALGASCQTI